MPMSQFIVRKSIRMKATPDKVWDALTNPKKTKKYFFNCEVHSDWKVGNPITFKGKMFLIINIEMTGHILQIIPEKLLQYNLKNRGSNRSSISTVTEELSYANNETVLAISDDVGDGADAEKRYRKSIKGWNKVLRGLKKLVETEI